MIEALLVAGFLLALLLSGASSGSETGVYCLDRVRLRVATEKRWPAALRLERLMRRPEDLVITALLGTNIADYLATAFMAALLLHVSVSPGWTDIYATAIVTPLILVFGGIIPKDWFRRQSNELMIVLSGPLLVGLRMARATGLVWLLRNVTHRLVRWIDPQRADDESDLLPRTRIVHLLREGAARGGLTSLQRDLIERVLNLSTVQVRDVMVRRTRAATVSSGISRDDFLRVARMAHFSRLPVWEHDPRNVVGVVNVYDVITDANESPVVDYMRKPLTLPEHMSVAVALLRLQRAREAMGIVQDRAGHCVGLLTLKDLVEEIVGDLEAW